MPAMLQINQGHLELRKSRLRNTTRALPGVVHPHEASSPRDLTLRRKATSLEPPKFWSHQSKKPHTQTQRTPNLKNSKPKEEPQTQHKRNKPSKERCSGFCGPNERPNGLHVTLWIFTQGTLNASAKCLRRRDREIQYLGPLWVSCPECGVHGYFTETPQEINLLANIKPGLEPLCPPSAHASPDGLVT